VFGLGMCQASMLAGLVASRIDPVGVRRFRARFVNVFWPGEVLTYGFVVGRKHRDATDGHRLVELELTCSRAGGEAIVRAWMTVDLG
jgi:acyl dehydratase